MRITTTKRHARLKFHEAIKKKTEILLDIPRKKGKASKFVKELSA
jgi:hypothetical protein